MKCTGHAKGGCTPLGICLSESSIPGNELTHWLVYSQKLSILGIALAAQNVGAPAAATVVVEVVFACSLMPQRNEGWFVS